MSLLLIGRRATRRRQRSRFVPRALAVDASTYYMTDGFSTNYQVFVPDDSALVAKGWLGQPYRLIFYFHGSGSQGSDNVAQMTGGSELGEYLGYVSGVPSTTFPCMVAFPQMLQNRTGTDPLWSSPSSIYGSRGMHMIMDAILTDLETLFAIDRRRLYLTGFSLGGQRMWDYAYVNPTKFAAFFPAAGNINTTFANVVPDQTLGMTRAQCAAVVEPALRTMPIRLTYSASDGNIPIAEMQPTLDAFAGDSTFTAINTGTSHTGVSAAVYDALTNPAGSSLQTWLFAQSR